MTYSNIRIRANKKHSYLLIDEVTELPPLFSSIYIVEVLSSRKIGTQKRELTSLRFFHDFWFKKYNETFDSFFLNADYNIVECCNQLNSFFEYLNFKQIQTFQMLNDTQEKQSSIANRAGNVYGVHRFLKFLNTRYMNVVYQKKIINDVEKIFSNNNKRLEDAIRPYSKLQKNSKDCSNKYKSITKEQHRLLDDMLLPSIPEFIDHQTQHHYKSSFNPLNPFKSSFEQFRNYLIHRLIFNYGLRAGEVLLLTVNSFGVSQPDSHGQVEYLLSVVNLDDDEAEFRDPPITLKNPHSQRMISLTATDYNYFLIYVRQFRHQNNTNIINHNFLITSSRGNFLPLTYSALRKIYQIIDVQFCSHYPEFKTGKNFQDMCTLTPHVGRHTWAYITLEYIYNQLLEKEINLNKQYGISSRLIGLLDAAADQLRRLGGWSIKSKMPYRYARRYVEKLANESNINRIESERLVRPKANHSLSNIADGEFDAFH